MVIGLVLRVKGADFFVSGASSIAKKFKIPAIFIGLTIVAIGTSLPELATTIAAARKGENELVLGNVIGSNDINMSLVLGAVALISQVAISTAILIDILILAVCTLIFAIMCMTRKKLPRYYGAIFVIIYFAYLAFSIVRNYCFIF